MAEELSTAAKLTEDMDLESSVKSETGSGDVKRDRDEEENGGATKKPKIDDEKSVEEERLGKKLEGEAQKENGNGSDLVKLGPKEFASSVQMFEYFLHFLQFWPHDLNVNKYEYMVLLDLIKKGHPEPAKKIGGGIKAFQIQNHPMWKNRCFFIIREDDTVDDFSFRKCVDHILPLPENMKSIPGGRGHGGGGRGRGGGGRGRGRGGRFRN